jgi:beta-lactamase class A
MVATDELTELFGAADVDGFLHVRDLETGAEIGHQADHPVVAASTFKVPVLVTLFRQADAGLIDLTEQTTVPVEDRAPGPTGTSVMLDPVTLSWRDLALWMIVVSDNAATDFICAKVGIDNVNATMDELGLPGTKLETDCRGIFATMAEDAGIASLEDFPRKPSNELVARLRALDPLSTNRSTPREMTRLLELIWTDKAASAEGCERMRQILRAQVWPHRLASGFPEDDITTGGKTGTLTTVRNEAGVVEYPDGARYAAAVFTRAPRARQKNPAADAVIGRSARAAIDALRARAGDSG